MPSQITEGDRIKMLRTKVIYTDIIAQRDSVNKGNIGRINLQGSTNDITEIIQYAPILFTPVELNKVFLNNNVVLPELAAYTDNTTNTQITVPGIITGVSVYRGNASATVSWIPPASNGGSAITGYIITPSVGSPVTVGNVLSVTINGLTNGTEVTFTVSAINAAGSSLASSLFPVTPSASLPGAPTGVSAVVAINSTTVSWTAPASIGTSPITGYIVTPSVGNPITVGNVLFATLNTLANGIEVTFTVSAINASGNSSSSITSSPVIPVTEATVPGSPTVPVSPTVTGVASDFSVLLSWNVPSNGGSVITGYTVSSTNGITTTTSTTTLTTINITGLTYGIPYTFTVFAKNNIGDSLGSTITKTPGVLTWTQRTTDAPQKWISVASSSDGTKLVAVTGTSVTGTSGYIYTSTNSGISWEQKTFNLLNWTSVASSSDGTKLVAVANNEKIYTSTDSGNIGTWFPNYISRKWSSVASSSDGTKLVAVAYPGYIYTSITSGTSWAPKTSDVERSWVSVASSSDGTKLVATVNGGQIYTSTDSGNIGTWFPKDSPRNWTSVASSSDGTKLFATAAGDKIYVSENSGDTWFPKDSVLDWRWIASSSDGTKLVAVVFNGHIYRSIDSGTNWIQQTTDRGRYWRCVSSSSDGTKLAAVVLSTIDGYIYTSP